MRQREVEIQETRDARIKASRRFWRKFDRWMTVQGCQTFAEGLRAAIRYATEFGSENQRKSA